MSIDPAAFGERMGELQALVTGMLLGALMAQRHFAIDVEPVMDELGYLPEICVRGQESGERVC